MSFTKPPCKTPDGQDCPRRYIGCQSACEAYHEWLAVHADEKERIRRNKYAENDTTAFIVGREKRKRRVSQSRYERDRRNRG